MTASNNLRIIPLLLLVLSALVHASACLSDLHPHEELVLLERSGTYFHNGRVSSGRRGRREALHQFPPPLGREVKRLFSNVKRIAALMSAFIGLVMFVRNWYLPLFIRFKRIYEKKDVNFLGLMFFLARTSLPAPLPPNLSYEQIYIY